jgi:hypothetical protein
LKHAIVPTSEADTMHPFDSSSSRASVFTMSRDVPVLAFGAKNGSGDAMIKTMELVASDVRGGGFENCGHYMPEEAPRALVAQVVDFWKNHGN